MKRFLTVVVFLFVFLTVSSTDCEAEISRNVQYNLSENGTLTISGKGKIMREDVYHVISESSVKVYKLVLKDGITDMQKNCFVGFASGTRFVDISDSVEEVILPGTVKCLKEKLFSGFSNLRRIKLEKGLQKIGDECFADCKKLEDIKIPDTVTYIGNEVFSDCKSLKKIVLPKRLKTKRTLFNKERECPCLKTIVNRSNVSCSLDDSNGYKVWYASGQKVTVVPPGKTARAEFKKIPLKYNLLGGRATGKLPRYHTYGTVLRLPDNCVKKDGYAFLAWAYKGKSSADAVFSIGPSTKEITLFPMWYIFKLENIGKGTVRIKINGKNCKIYYPPRYDVRYSEHKDMSDSQILYEGEMSKKGDTIFYALNLKRGKKYYFQLRFCDDDEYESIWVGKECITVK